MARSAGCTCCCASPATSGLPSQWRSLSYATEQSLRPGRSGFLRFGASDIPLATERPDSALVDFHNSFPAAVVPVSRLLAPGFDANIFRGKIVVIGQSSEMGKDLFSTPAFRFRPSQSGRSVLSGAEIHAAAVASLIDGRFPHRMAVPLEWTLNFLFAAMLILLLMHMRWWLGVAAFLAATAGVLTGAGWLFSHQQLWAPVATTEACLVLGLPMAFGYRYLEEQRLKLRSEAERRQLMNLFERYVSADVAAEIWKRRGEIVLAGEERVATVLFSDIRNFTALTAGKPSAEVLAWLNRYLTAMTEVVKANGGFLNKFIGDGIMVIFGVPLSQDENGDACRAVQCALQMLEQVEVLNSTMGTEPRLKIGIGIHTGTLTAGNVGSPERLEYSVIGETVNLASPPGVADERVQDGDRDQSEHMGTNPRELSRGAPRRSRGARVQWQIDALRGEERESCRGAIMKFVRLLFLTGGLLAANLAIGQAPPPSPPPPPKPPQSTAKDAPKAPPRKRLVADLSGFEMSDPNRTRKQRAMLGATRGGPSRLPLLLAPDLAKFYGSSPLFAWLYPGRTEGFEIVLRDDDDNDDPEPTSQHRGVPPEDCVTWSGAWNWPSR